MWTPGACISTTPSSSITERLAIPKTLQSAKPYRRLQTQLRRKVVRRRLVRYGFLASNIAILAVIALIVLQNSQTTSPAAKASISSSAVTAPANPLDRVSSAGIALTVARLSSLPETTAITNQADSQAAEMSLDTTTNSIINKPQVVATVLKSKADIKTYTTQAGDTLAGLAVKFGVTSNSIQWSNNSTLSNGALQAGLKLVIPPVSGIVYVVKAGDTPATLSARYNASAAQIIAYNDAEVGGLTVGEQIIIPSGTVTPAVVTNNYSGWGTATYGYNGYDFGYCTWWVAKLRADAGKPLPTNLGDASSWAIRARAYGLSVGTTPAVGAAVVTATRGQGHVAYVTAVNPDGSITISEMNHLGWDVTNTQTLSGSYSYIY